MIVSIHQPHLLPWLGYLDRMRRSDLFVILDHVQFERQNYQNRVSVKTPQGPLWLVVPVRQASRSERIIDKRIDNQASGRHRWGRRMYLTLEHSYRGAPFFEPLASELRSVLDREWESLVDLNLCLIELLRERLGIRTPLLRSSTLDVRGRKAEGVLEICRAVGATVFLGGLGGSRSYLNPAAFERAGIEVQWQEFTHPQYPQRPVWERFVPGLSAIDMLFNCGPESAAILASGAR